MSDDSSGLLDAGQIAELFSDVAEAETRENLREIFRQFYADVELELAALTTSTGPVVLAGQLHRLKGMMANYGFAHCARLLASWEAEAATADPAQRCQQVLQAFLESRAALGRHYAWLH